MSTKSGSKHTALTTIEPRHAAAAADLYQRDPATLAVLLKDCQRAARGTTDLDTDDLASLASILAPVLLAEGITTSQAATVATKRAASALRSDRINEQASTVTDPERQEMEKAADAAAAAGETPLDRLASPRSIDPAAPFRTTDTDRLADTLADMDAASAATLRAAYSAEHKGGKYPAAAVRRALCLPPVTGRAGTAWTATLAAEVPVLLAAAQDAAAAMLTEHAQGVEPWQPLHYVGTPRSQPTDAAAALADKAAKTRPADDARRTQDRPKTSGPASQVVSLRLFYAGPMVGHIDTATAHAVSLPTVRRQASALASTLPTTLPAHREGTERQERDDFDAEAASAARKRLPGVSTDRDGRAVAPSGQSGYGSGSEKAATRTPAPRKASRAGGTGPTIPTGPRR